MIAISLMSAGCLGGITKEGPLTVRAGSIERHADGSLRLAMLAEPAEIETVPCSGWTRFHPGGQVESTDLARDTMLGGHPIPARSRVFFDSDGVFQSAFLSRDTRIDGIPCEGGIWKSQTAFHPNGRVSETFLFEDAEIQGVPCAETSQVPVRFDPQGKLIGCKLSRAASLAGKQYKRGERIEFQADGSVVVR